jgi:O-glycosyl hydrolase
MMAGRQKLFVAAVLLVCAARAAWAVNITVDTGTRHQTIEGLGTCLCFWISDPYSTSAFQEMYYQDLGCSVLRMELQPRCLNPALGDETDTYLGPNIDDNVALFNFGAQSGGEPFGSFVRAADRYAIDDVKLVGSIWTPPHYMKTSSGPDTTYRKSINTSGDSCKGHLIATADNYTQFGRYVAAFVKGWEQCWGVPIEAVSMQNEPAVAVSYNSCLYYCAGRHDGVIEYPQPMPYAKDELVNNGLTCKLMGPEETGVGGCLDPWCGWCQMMYVYDIRAYPNSLAALDGYATHHAGKHGYRSDGGVARVLWDEYWNGRTNNDPAGCVWWPGIGADNKEFSYQTETCGEATTWLHTNADGNEDGALSLAVSILEAFVYHPLNLWCYWQTTDTADSGDGSDQCLTGGANNQAPKYVAAKHLFRYIRPGSERVGATPALYNDLNVGAFVNDPNHSLTIVLVNMAPTGETADITLPAQPSISAFNGWRSSNTERFAAIGPYTVSGGTISVPVPAQSVVTLYGGDVGAGADAYSTASGQTLAEGAPGVLGNDVCGVTAALAAGPSHGSLALNADGSFEYSPDPGYSGTDSFTYTASNANDSETATVTLYVGGSMHVSEIHTGVKAGNGGTPTATVYIVDEYGQPVEGATVDITFYVNARGGTQGWSGVTNECGQAWMAGWRWNGLTEVTTCVDEVTHPYRTYDSGANVVTCVVGEGESDTTPPAPPTSLVATAAGSSQIDLDWDDNTEPDLAGYNVYRDGEKVAETVESSAYSDIGLSPSTTYCYTATALDTSSNESAHSDQDCATTQPGGGGTMHVDSITVEWLSAGGPNRKGQATVVIKHQAGAAVSGATVTGTFTGTLSETQSGTTDGTGTAVIQTVGKTRDPGPLTFCVDSVTHATVTYEPGDNVETCDTN